MRLQLLALLATTMVSGLASANDVVYFDLKADCGSFRVVTTISQDLKYDYTDASELQIPGKDDVVFEKVTATSGNSGLSIELLRKPGSYSPRRTTKMTLAIPSVSMLQGNGTVPGTASGSIVDGGVVEFSADDVQCSVAISKR